MSDLSPELLLLAYRIGVFPMSESADDPEVFWVDPEQRGVLPIDGFRISRSLAKRIKSNRFRVTFDTAFEQVVRRCADRRETWINDTIYDAYCTLHDLGYAHSVDVWDDKDLVGGAYGIAIGGAFFGESMFSNKTDASKVALAYLTDHLNQLGFRLLDTQFITPHLASLGAIEIPRARYKAQLAEAIDLNVRFKAHPVATAQEVLQRKIQTS